MVASRRSFILRRNAAPHPHRRRPRRNQSTYHRWRTADAPWHCRFHPGSSENFRRSRCWSFDNGTLLAREITPNRTIASALRVAGVHSLNISLDTLDRSMYAQITGRDFLPLVLQGIDGAVAEGFDQIKLNTVLMRGRNEDQFIPLI